MFGNVFNTVGNVLNKVRGVLRYAQTVEKWAKIASAVAKHFKALDDEITEILGVKKDETSG